MIEHIKFFKDLETEIEACKLRMECFQDDIKRIERSWRGPSELSGFSADGMPQGNRDETTLDVQVNIIRNIQNKFIKEEERVKLLEERKQAYTDLLSKFKGVEYKIAYLYYIEGLTQEEIGKEMGYCREQVNRIMKKNSMLRKDIEVKKGNDNGEC